MERQKVEDELTREAFEDCKPFKNPNNDDHYTYSRGSYRNDVIFFNDNFRGLRSSVYAKIKLITDEGILISRSVFNREVEVFIMFHDLKLADLK